MDTMNMWVVSSASGYKKNASGRSTSEREKTNSFAKYFLSNSMNETDYYITVIPHSTECPFIFFSPRSNLWIQFVIQNVYESVFTRVLLDSWETFCNIKILISHLNLNTYLGLLSIYLSLSKSDIHWSIIRFTLSTRWPLNMIMVNRFIFYLINQIFKC